MSIVNEMFRKYLHRVFLIVGDIREFSLKYADTVIMNPPFGVVKRNRGLDLLFLKRAMEFSRTIYTIHKYSEGLIRLVNELASAFNYEIIHSEEMFFPIQMIYPSHYRKVYRVKIIFYVLRRK
jgi:putative methylase